MNRVIARIRVRRAVALLLGTAVVLEARRVGQAEQTSITTPARCILRCGRRSLENVPFAPWILCRS